MTLRSWRIVKAKEASIAFSGNGAKIFGGRWNSPGTSIIYTAGSVSLAILEMLVHLQVDDLLNNYELFEVDFDEALVISLDMAEAPVNWATLPAPQESQRIGDEWSAAASSAILRVPSAVVSNEANYLINPQYPAFDTISIGVGRKIQLDPRLIKTARP